MYKETEYYYWYAWINTQDKKKTKLILSNQNMSDKDVLDLMQAIGASFQNT